MWNALAHLAGPTILTAAIAALRNLRASSFPLPVHVAIPGIPVYTRHPPTGHSASLPPIPVLPAVHPPVRRDGQGPT